MLIFDYPSKKAMRTTRAIDKCWFLTASETVSWTVRCTIGATLQSPAAGKELHHV